MLSNHPLRVTKEEALVGKTIDRVVAIYENAIGFRFTDGTIFYVASRGCSYDVDDRDTSINFVNNDEVDVDELLALGLISEDVFEQRRRDDARMRELNERANYERLKKKFEGNP